MRLMKGGGLANFKERHCRLFNRDMWQRFNDCIICEQKSMPNAQGVLIHRSSRNLMVAFNKVLQIWRYEKDDKELHAGFLSSQYPAKQQM